MENHLPVTYLSRSTSRFRSEEMKPVCGFEIKGYKEFQYILV